MNGARAQSNNAGPFELARAFAERTLRRIVKWNRIMAATFIGFTVTASVAQTPEELLLLLPPWDAVLTARAGGGYKDNPLLSHFQPQGSAFVSGGADVLILHAAPTGPQFNFFASADAAHYLTVNPQLNEYTAFARAQLEQDLRAGLQASLAAEYFYQDQILDVSFLDVSASGTNAVIVRAAPVRGHTLTLRPGVRLDLPQQFWLSLEFPGTRQYYDQRLDDYWRAGVKVTVGHSYGHDSQLSLSYEPAWRFYDADPALTESGTPIPGTHRRRFQHDAQLAWRHYWDEPKHWRTTVKLGGRLSRENGGGFTDDTRYSAAAQIQYRARPWEASVESRVHYYDFDTQTVSSVDLSRRKRTEWNVAVRLERELSKHLKFTASYEYEQTLSNDESETYTVNTVSGGLSWEF